MKKISGWKIGMTSSKKTIHQPYRLDQASAYFVTLKKEFDYFELFEAYAIYEHMTRREKRLNGEETEDYRVLINLSRWTREYLFTLGVFDDAKEIAIVDNSIQIAEFGRKLVFPLYR